jgi:EAL domain-containing protein (putative c-di-GMP-specific phosphodiesterase class I)
MYRTIGQRQTESARNYVDYSVPTPALDTIVSLAASTLGFSMAMVNILDGTTMYTLAEVGLPDDYSSVSPSGLSHCRFVVQSADVIGIEDSASHPKDGHSLEAATARRMADIGVASFLGVALFGREGVPIGSLCVLDYEPHPLGEYAVETLRRFAIVVENQLEVMRGHGRRVGHAPVSRIAAALDNREIVPWFQPIVDLGSGEIVALETLARWECTTGDVYGPNAFMPAITDSDLIVDVDHSVLQQALEHLSEWQRRVPGLQLNSNLSARHLGRRDRLEQLASIVGASGTSPDCVVFELTETQAHTDMDHIGDFVEALRGNGFSIMLDDIGIGWSSLERLLNLPVDGFKIDTAIAAKLGTRTGDSMIRALAGLAADTEQKLIIEGCETPIQSEKALELGCTHAQGYLWSRPVPAEQVPDMLDLHAMGFPGA